MSLIDPTPYHGITLYSHPNDYYSHSVRLVLAEKNIEYRLILVDDDEEDLTQLNPYGSLPTLVDPQVRLFNASIMNEYIDSRYRQSRLFADAPAEAAQQRQFLWRIEQDWFKLADILLRHPDTLDKKQQEAARSELSDILINLSPLFQHYPYFMSEQFSILDCWLIPILLRLSDMQISFSAKHSKALILYCKRVFARESFKRSLTSFEQTRYSKTLKQFDL